MQAYIRNPEIIYTSWIYVRTENMCLNILRLMHGFILLWYVNYDRYIPVMGHVVIHDRPGGGIKSMLAE